MCEPVQQLIISWNLSQKRDDGCPIIGIYSSELPLLLHSWMQIHKLANGMGTRDLPVQLPLQSMRIPLPLY